MEVYIDGQRLDPSEYETDDDLVELLAGTKAHLGEKIVDSVVVDGEQVDPNRPEINPDLDDVERIDIELKDVNKLMEETVKNLHEYAPEVRKGLEKAQAGFRLGDKDKGYSLLRRSLEGMEWCVGVAQRLDNLKNGEMAAESRENLEQMFDKIKKIIEMAERYELQETSFMTDNIDSLIDYAEAIECFSDDLYEHICGNGELEE
ncbi:hypothetical protein [Halarsenatibacter silvermanii]|uniref:Uncharacterized protein n=1 Tax=Halarsenatibacter silvermanii TaxID=321763 RepID=A0A1G9M1D5_9FIRM|nr:hypothetical protein [Halarsenatibacter silvermanii]SDL68018.1 hypothetical protein SAMN04488692_10775 [Halarsenatibacter silvermanii]